MFLKILCFLCLSKRKSISKDSIKKILIYGYMGIGNMIFFTPTIRAIRKYFPQASITLLVGNNTRCEEVVSKSDLVDEIIDFNPERATIMQRLMFIKRMRDRRFDLLISDFHGADLFLALLAVLANIPYRVGHSTSPGWRNRLDYVYNFKVEMAENEHEIERDLRLAYTIGIKENKVDKNPVMWIGEEDKEYANKFLKQYDIYNEDLVIGVQVGTSPTMRWKQWSLDRYAELCDRLIENYGAKIILFGSSNELELTNYVVQKMKYNPINAAGKTTVKQAAAIIERCKLFVANDSGLAKVSAAVGTPTITIWGPSDYPRAKAWNNLHIDIRKTLPCSPCFRIEGAEKAENCPYKYKCLTSITVDEVFDAVTIKLKIN